MNFDHEELMLMMLYNTAEVLITSIRMIFFRLERM